jgi:hypothetical protein
MDGKSLHFVVIDEVTESKHAKTAFPAAFSSWCDAGDHEVLEGELIIRSDSYAGFVHLNCL